MEEQTPITAGLVEVILNNVADGVFTVDANFRITYFNRAAEQLTGFARAETLGRPCYEIFRTGICGQDCPLRQSLRAGRVVKNVEIDILTRTGSRQTISVCTAPLVDAAGKFIGGVESFRELHLAPHWSKSGQHNYEGIVSQNHKLRQIIETLPNIARSDAAALIVGGRGAGKVLLARAIHNGSPRKGSPFARVLCSALPEPLLAEQLFGRAAGTPTDDAPAVRGCLETSWRGTVYLDEIEALPRPLQSRLRQAMETAEIRAPGAAHGTPIDVRIIAATAHDPERLVAEGRLDPELLDTLGLITIRIPALRERREDLPLLVDHFLKRCNRELGEKIERLSEEAMAVLLRYNFPGNVRELEHAIEHAHVVSRGPQIRPRDLPAHIIAAVSTPRRPRRPAGHRRGDDRIDDRKRLVEVLESNGWNMAQAARALRMHRTTLWRRIKQLQITPP